MSGIAQLLFKSGACGADFLKLFGFACQYVRVSTPRALITMA